MSEHHLSVPMLTRRLAELAASGGTTGPSYNIVVDRVRCGLIPAIQRGGKWWVREADLPAVAALFGLDDLLPEPPQQPEHQQQPAA